MCVVSLLLSKSSAFRITPLSLGLHPHLGQLHCTGPFIDPIQCWTRHCIKYHSPNSLSDFQAVNLDKVIIKSIWIQDLDHHWTQFIRQQESSRTATRLCSSTVPHQMAMRKGKVWQMASFLIGSKGYHRPQRSYREGSRLGVVTCG